jgi:hypothetical protein
MTRKVLKRVIKGTQQRFAALESTNQAQALHKSKLIGKSTNYIPADPILIPMVQQINELKGKVPFD